jgi:arylsulfatase A-like enzyme
MNYIGIMLDSFRQDHISAYNRGQSIFPGIAACRTPHLDAFADECIVFENAYPGGLPTIPVRTELLTGQETLPFRPWQPLTQEDISAAEILRRHGYTCGLVSDCYHYRAPRMNFHRGFHTYRWIRGQEYDPWTSHAPRRDLERYVNGHYDDVWRGRVAQFLANTDDFTREEDWFPAKVVDEAVDWLTKNRDQKNVFLWLDSFDPHEPWDPMPAWDTYTDPNYAGKRLILPLGGLAADWTTPAEKAHIQGLYAGEATFVDHCLGRLFDALRDLGYYDDTVLVLTADHGHPLADHGKFLKGGDRMYSELLKVPFMVRLPGGQGARRTQALVQFSDVLPTVLDLLGLGSNSPPMHGRSFAPLLRGETDVHRAAIIAGYYAAVDRCVRDNTWSYVQRPVGEPDELYNLLDDPRERTNRIDDYPQEAQRLARLFGDIYRSGVPQVEVKGIQGKYELASSGIA